MAQYDINLREYWRILNKRKFIVIVTAVVLGFFSTAFAILRAPTPAYTSACSIKFEKETTVEGLFAKTISWSGGDDIETQLSVIKSYSVFEKVAEKLGLIPRGAKKEDSQLRSGIVGIVESLQARVKVTRESFTNILNIEATDTDPAFAQKLANTIALTYKELHSGQQMKRTTEAIKYIQDQLKDVRQKLKEAEEEFNKFSQEHQLISIDMQSEKLLGRAQGIQIEISKVREDKRELEGILAQLEQFIKNHEGSRRNFYSARASSQYQAANDALAGFLLKKDTLLEDYTPQHPEVVEINRRIGESAKKMVILLRVQIKDMENKEADQRDDLSGVEKKTSVLMEKKLEYDRLRRKVDLYNDTTGLLERKNQEALIRQAEKPEEITIVKPAHLPADPVNPPRTGATGAMGVLIGLVLGLVAAFVVETFDTSLGAIEDVEETLGTQVLGVIPDVDLKEIQESIEEKQPAGVRESSLLETAHLVCHFSPKSMIAESFRALRTNIQFKDAEQKIKTIAITSASPQEGKSLVSISLAITMAQAGMKTLLVGSDMRKPMLSRVFGVEMTPGLTDILLGNYPWRDTVKTITDIIMGKMTLDDVMMTPGLDNLHLITSGSIPPNPAILLESKRLKEFTEEAQKEYDLIIFDSPPILSTADAAILGAKVGGVLLVYRVGSVSRGLLKRAATQLKQVECNVLGVILNGMKPEISPDFQDFKYYKYYYSYGDEKKGKKREREKRSFSSLFKWREAGRIKTEKVPTVKETKESGGEEGKKHGLLKLALVAVAVACLTLGILWQNGLLDLYPDRPVPKDEPKPALSKGLPDAATPKTDDKRAVPPQPSTTLAAPAEPTPEAQVSVPQPQPAPKHETTALSSEKPLIETQPAVTLSPTETLYPFSLYLGSHHSLEQARKAISTFRGKGISPYWAKVDLKEKGVWFRIYVGYFKSAQEAEIFGKEYGLTDASARKTEYANLIGVYSSAPELETKTAELEKLGYAPYIIKGYDGRQCLLVGAYVTEEGAERESSDLKAAGVETQVVKRISFPSTASHRFPAISE